MDKDLTKGPIGKTLFMFFLPILLGTLFQQLYNTVDTLIIGQFLGTKPLAAMGATVHLTSIVVYFFVGLSTGASVVISNYYGAKEYHQIPDTIITSFYLAVVSGILMMLFGLCFGKSLLILLNVPQEILPYSVTYFNYYFLSMIPACIYNIGASLIRGMGNSKTPLYYLIICSCVNIVLDLLFVLVFKMGIAGAAIATTFSQLICAILIVIKIFNTYLKNTTYSLKPDFNILKRILIIGVPTGLQSNMWSVSNLFIQTHVNILGTYAIAGLTAYEKVEDFYWMIQASINNTVTTFVSQNFGAKQNDRNHQAIRISLIFSIVSSLLFSVVMIVLGKYLARIFTTDMHTIKQYMTVAYSVAFGYVFYSFICVYSAELCGYGNAHLPLIVSFSGTCLLRILFVSFITPMFNTLFMTMICYPITWFITAVIYLCITGRYVRQICQKETDVSYY